MAIKDVVTRGYITGGDDSIARVVTRGYGVGVLAVADHQPGATPQLVQLQAPGRPRVDILLVPLTVDIDVPAPIDLRVEAEAFAELVLPRGGVLPLRLHAQAAVIEQLPVVGGLQLPSLRASVAVYMREVDTAALLREELDERLREEEELWLLGVR